MVQSRRCTECDQEAVCELTFFKVMSFGGKQNNYQNLVRYTRFFYLMAPMPLKETKNNTSTELQLPVKTEKKCVFAQM